MQIEIGSWSLQKSGEENDKTVRVRMVANMMEPDKEDQQIVPQAFNKATVQQFIDEGIIEWFHKTITGKTMEEKCGAILGRPVSFAWEDGLPVVYADLTKAHPIVRDYILPHLEAGNNVFGASVGGKIAKITKAFDEKLGRMKDKVTSMIWQHLAIAPLPYVVSGGSAVSLVKAKDGGEDTLQFADMDSFITNHDIITLDADQILKAMEAGTATDSAGMTGHDAIRQQSLEGDHNKYVIKLAQAIKDKTIQPTARALKAYLRDIGLGEDDTRAIYKAFQAKVRSGAKDILQIAKGGHNG